MNLLVILLTALIPQLAFSGEIFSTHLNPGAGFHDIREVRIERLGTYELSTAALTKPDYENDCSGLKPQINTLTDAPTIGSGEISIETIINIAKKAWAFIQDNKAVVDAKTQMANALPRGVKCWDDLGNWQRPRSEVFKATYLNGFNMEVVVLEYRLVYAYGGDFNGKGKYITNATLQYRNLNVMWGFKLNADVQVPLVINVGNKENPVAGMQLSLHWIVSSLNHNEATSSFFIYGDGRPTDVLD